MYARRVRTLVYPQLCFHISDVDDDNNEPFDDWHDIDWESIMRYHPGGPLLPNLHTFESDYEFLLCIRPPLRHLRLRYWEMGEAEEVTQALRTCSQTLETSRIVVAVWDTIDPKATLSLSQAITEMQVLTTVDVEMLLPHALEHLGCLRTLRELHFAIDDIGIATTPLPFPTLERLRLKTHIADAALMVSVLSIPLGLPAPPKHA